VDHVQGATASGEAAVRALYAELLDAWNRRNSSDFASLFAGNGMMIGFDGSQVLGMDVEAHLAPIFADHPMASYVSKIRDVRALSPQVVLLSAIAGMAPLGQTKINPTVNAVQSLLAQRRGDSWRIVLYQNTPAQHYGRPELVAKHTAELQQVLDSTVVDSKISR
jgi:uncharacterized protein (TIGR02246 family)